MEIDFWASTLEYLLQACRYYHNSSRQDRKLLCLGKSHQQSKIWLAYLETLGCNMCYNVFQFIAQDLCPIHLSLFLVAETIRFAGLWVPLVILLLTKKVSVLVCSDIHWTQNGCWRKNHCQTLSFHFLY